MVLTSAPAFAVAAMAEAGGSLATLTLAQRVGGAGNPSKQIGIRIFHLAWRGENNVSVNEILTADIYAHTKKKERNIFACSIFLFCIL